MTVLRDGYGRRYIKPLHNGHQPTMIYLDDIKGLKGVGNDTIIVWSGGQTRVLEVQVEVVEKATGVQP